MVVSEPVTFSSDSPTKPSGATISTDTVRPTPTNAPPGRESTSVRQADAPAVAAKLMALRQHVEMLGEFTRDKFKSAKGAWSMGLVRARLANTTLASPRRDAESFGVDGTVMVHYSRAPCRLGIERLKVGDFDRLRSEH